MADKPDTAERNHRYMIEEIAVTPFFKRHRGHMPATIKLHAEIRQEGNLIILESRVHGYSEDQVRVSATPNAINVDLVLEKRDFGEVRLHNSYFTPLPIVHSSLRVELKEGLLKVSVPTR